MYLISVQDLGHASVADAQLSRNDAGSNPGRGHLDDL